MPSVNPRIKDILYTGRKVAAFQSKNYDLVKKWAPVLHKPIFTIGGSKLAVEDLTYRKINDWENKDMISGSRKRKTVGWRRFSVIDVVKLCVISDLRRLGFSIEKIKTIVDKISDIYVDGITPEGKVRIRFMQLEYSILDCIDGNKVFLLIDEKENVCFLTEEDTAFTCFYIDSDFGPLLILPFFSYVKKIVRSMKKDIRIRSKSTVRELFKIMLPERERKILEIIRDKKYEQIIVRKPDNEKILIRAKSRRRGKLSDEDIIKIINEKEYQTITVITDKGRKVDLIQEENIKV